MSTPELNAPQADAVVHSEGPLLVFAGAGSGKTRVITYRIANLVACERVPPYRILAVTFTNKAAGEMRSRLEAMLGPEIARELWVGTFHATCAKLLRRYGEPVGLTKSFVIYDTSDQKAVVTRVLRELAYDDKRYQPKAVLARIHKEKQEGKGPADMSTDSYVDDAIQKVYVRYEKALLAANAVDFEDLILKTVELLKGKSQEGRTLREKFSYVLVDEFQDTNATQYALLRELSRETRNLCVVGDDDQSIYRWRGADVRNIRGFQQDYADAKVVKLEQNYRSTDSIVQAALGVIAPSRQRVPKELWTDNPAGAKVRVVATADERDEAVFMLRTIREARKAGVSLSEMAVFYRIHAQSRVLEEVLRSENIAYQIVGGTKFYERAEIKDAIAYLRVLLNPQSDVDLLRIINVPARGIGSTTIERLTLLATARQLSVSETLVQGLNHADADGKPLFAAAAKKRLEQLGLLLIRLREEALTLAPHEMLDRILRVTGYRTQLETEDSAEAEARLENLAEFSGSMQDYAAEAKARGEEVSLEGFLERVSLQSDTETVEQTERVTLMTVHGAKGLEFEVVVLTGMEEDMFPYRGMQERDSFDPEQLDEERRLAYVAITRARHNLVITHTRTRQIFGNTRYGTPSRFLGDIPREVSSLERSPALSASYGGASAGGGSGAHGRYVDRGYVHDEVSQEEPRPAPQAPGVASGTWVHPQAGLAASRPKVPAEPAEGTFVDREFFDDASDGSLEIGSRVQHARFGEGRVRKILQMGEPAVLAFFPGWGEMKVLSRFLRPA